jgi:hypothetical protein
LIRAVARRWPALSPPRRWRSSPSYSRQRWWRYSWPPASTRPARWPRYPTGRGSVDAQPHRLGGEPEEPHHVPRRGDDDRRRAPLRGAGRRRRVLRPVDEPGLH